MTARIPKTRPERFVPSGQLFSPGALGSDRHSWRSYRGYKPGTWVTHESGHIGNTLAIALLIEGRKFAAEPVKVSRSARCRETLTEPGMNFFVFFLIAERWLLLL